MSLPYIRRTYGVPARRGLRVRYTDGAGVIWNGTITSAKGPHLRSWWMIGCLGTAGA